MVNLNRLKGKIVEKGFSVETLSRTIGMNKATMYRKFNDNAETFSIKEATAISKALSLNAYEIAEFFFAHDVA